MKDWCVREKTAHRAFIHKCTGPWWVTFPARPVWFCPSWCHRRGRWTDVESQRAVYQRSWQRRADLAPPPVSERERREREGNREKNLFDTEWWNLEKQACSQYIHLMIGFTYSSVLCDGHVGWVWVHIKPKPPCSQTNLLVTVPCLCCICQRFSRPLAQSSSEPS